MEMNVFAEKLQRGIQKMLGAETKVTIREVRKNNGVLLHGLMIIKPGENVSPTIYLNAFLELYQQGTTLREIADKVLTIYEGGMPRQKIDMDFFKDFELVKDKIVYKIINTDKNRYLLDEVPHMCYLDLAICFYYAFYNEVLGNGMILIYNTHVKMWETDTDELFRLACENTPKLNPAEFKSMDEVLADMYQEDQDIRRLEADERQFFRREMPMQILSNQKHIYGAACLLYPGMLESISQKFSHNFYILPSSIHEVIILADKGREDPGHLSKMVKEVNQSQVEPEEVLSDYVYYYDHHLRAVKIIF